MSTETVYKIFRTPVIGSGMSSAVIADRLGSGLIKYSAGKWTKALDVFARNGYHLTCFNTVRSARKFYREQLSHHTWVQYELWKCEATGVFVPEVLRRNHLDYYELKGHFLKRKRSEMGTWPKGTLMAKRIKPVERIKL